MGRSDYWKIVDYGTLLGILTASMKVGEALMPFVPMRSMVVGLVTYLTSSPTLATATPALVQYGTAPAVGAGMATIISLISLRLRRS